MKKILFNDNNLKDSDITEVVTRVKVLLINSKKELMLGYSANRYQFPGGHLEIDETLDECLLREIKEETGITLEKKHYEPFMLIEIYSKDHPSIGKNRHNKIFYFEVICNRKPILNETDYTDDEKKGNFELRFISLTEVEKALLDNAKIYNDNQGIVKEMLETIKEYKESKK